MAARLQAGGEAVALTAFGLAWIVAGKIILLLVYDDEALRMFPHWAIGTDFDGQSALISFAASGA